MANIIQINDFNAPELDIYARLTEKQTANSNYFVAESPEVIRLALKSGCKPLSFLMEEKHIETTAKDLLEQRVIRLKPLKTQMVNFISQHITFTLAKQIYYIIL